MSATGKNNLKPVRSVSEAREKGAKGGMASGRSRRKKKLLREYLEALLFTRHDGMETVEAVTIALVEKALAGDVRAYEVIRDTMGQKPAEKVKQEGRETLVVRWKN